MSSLVERNQRTCWTIPSFSYKREKKTSTPTELMDTAKQILLDNEPVPKKTLFFGENQVQTLLKASFMLVSSP
jgi:hypothetical protein